jgi:hypothetical protein
LQLQELTDEVVQLEAQRDELGATVAGLTEELGVAKKEHAQRVKAEVRALSRRRVRVVGTVVAVGAVALVSFIVWAVNIEEVMLHGTVTRADGQVPVAVGARCRVRIEQEYGPYNAHVIINCGGARLYGSASGFGVIRCDTEGSVVTRCEDDRGIRFDGDPRLVIDRAAGQVHLDDGDRWQVDVQLDDARVD